MLELTITPRFCETDALKHINNSTFLNWFEQARIPIFKIFTPDLNPEKWRLILARNEIDYLSQVSFGEDIQIKTVVNHIGNSSMKITHELFQSNLLACRCKVVMIHFNYQQKKSVIIPDRERNELLKLKV